MVLIDEIIPCTFWAKWSIEIHEVLVSPLPKAFGAGTFNLVNVPPSKHLNHPDFINPCTVLYAYNHKDN